MDYYAFGHLDCDSVTGLYSINITILVSTRKCIFYPRALDPDESLVGESGSNEWVHLRHVRAEPAGIKEK